MGKGFAKVLAVLAVIWFWLWTGLGIIGNVQTAAYLAKHHDLIGLLAKTPPAYPGVAGLALAIVLCVLLLREPTSQQNATKIGGPGDIATGAEPPATHAALAVERPAPLKTVPQPSPRTEMQKAERIFVNRSVAELVQPYRDHVALQADALFQTYMGKWIRISGVVYTTEWWMGAQTRVTVWVEGGDSRLLVSLIFKPEWRDRLNILIKNDAITAVGKISGASEGGVRLEDCELES